MSGPSEPITLLLDAVNRDDSSARSRLWRLVYDELRVMAKRQLANEPAGITLQTTSLVHEVFMRLTGGEQIDWTSRRHFFGAAANAMRQIRVDDARRRKRHKRGSGRRPAELGAEDAIIFSDDPDQILALDEALKALEQRASRQAKVVNLRYFAGLSVDETASAMGVAPRTVDNDWKFAKAWLHRVLSDGDSQA
jgi:RNA polymerase sigma factor (TIGR02999 family)